LTWTTSRKGKTPLYSAAEAGHAKVIVDEELKQTHKTQNTKNKKQKTKNKHKKQKTKNKK
jgi:hypothetical protein